MQISRTIEILQNKLSVTLHVVKPYRLRKVDSKNHPHYQSSGELILR